MSELFIEILNMSISAGWVVLAVLLARLVLKKAPGWMRVTLWSAVGLRLLVPELPLSGLSLLPSSQTVSPEIMTSPNPVINSGVPVINTVVNNVLQENFVPAPEASANPMQILGAVAAVPAVVGTAMMGVHLFLVGATPSRLLTSANSGLVIMIPIAFAVSIEEPPPIATMQSAPLALKAATPF